MTTTNDTTQSTVLYKILTESEFNSLPLPPLEFNGTSFDLANQCIHICTSLQIPTTLATIFPSESKLWILALPRTDRLNSKLVWDVERETKQYCGRLIQLEGGLDIWGTEVALRRPISKDLVSGEWDLGELEY